MTADIVAVASMKGGVGKTTVALSLAEGSAALKQKRVLVVDLDPQINTSILLTGALPRDSVPWRRGISVLHFLTRLLTRHPTLTDQYVLQNLISFPPGKTVSLLPGDYDMRAFERRLLVNGNTLESAMRFMQGAVKSVIEEQGPLFDLIIFDCPPGFSIITEAAIERSDLVILPTAPNNLGTQGLLAFIKYLQDELRIAEAASRVRVFLTMTRNTTTSREFEKAVRAEEANISPQYRVLKITYPYLDGFQKAMDRRQKRMQVLGAVHRALNRVRNRTLFNRLYDGVDDHVARMVNEVWDVIQEQRAMS